MTEVHQDAGPSPGAERSEDDTTTKAIEFHPIADLFPLMDGKEFQELVDDINTHGQREPSVLFEDKILDGRNRYRACVKIGIEPEFKRFVGSREEARDLVISANLHRRHLTSEQKREVVELLLVADPEKSNRQIGEVAKASHHTVSTVRKQMEGRGQIAHVEKHTDATGRSQPSTKRPSAKAKAKRELEKQSRQKKKRLDAFKHAVDYISNVCEMTIEEEEIPENIPDEDREELIRSLLTSARNLSQLLARLGSPIGEQLLELAGEEDTGEEDTGEEDTDKVNEDADDASKNEAERSADDMRARFEQLDAGANADLTIPNILRRTKTEE